MIKIKTKPKVAVVGAGIAGLCAAYDLKNQDFDVVVFEKSAIPGGRMTTQLMRGLAFDGGADFFSENYATLKKYATELSIDWIPTKLNGRHRVIRGGKPYYLQFATFSDLARFKLLSVVSRLRLGLWLLRLMLSRKHFDMFDLSTLPASYDFGNAADYVKKVAGQQTADYIIDSFTSIMQFHRASDISTSALFALMQNMAAKKTRFALCSTPEGINQIPQAIASRIKVQRQSQVMSVSRSDGGLKVKVQGKKPLFFDAVVLATPAPITRKIIGSFNNDIDKFLAQVRYASTITVAFEIADDLFADGTHLSYVPFVENKIIGGYANEGAKLGARSRDGKTLINVYLHEEAAKKMIPWNDQKIFSRVLVELKKLCPELSNTNVAKPLSLARWPLAMPKFAHGYVSRVPQFLNDFQGKNGIYFAGDYLNAPWTEGAARSGKRAAAMMINDFISYEKK